MDETLMAIDTSMYSNNQEPQNISNTLQNAASLIKLRNLLGSVTKQLGGSPTSSSVNSLGAGTPYQSNYGSDENE